eukprot:scaffold49188_cov71-Phaeocystis_antarctica.AAC.4
MTQLALEMSKPSSATTVAMSRFAVPSANCPRRFCSSDLVTRNEGEAGEDVAYRQTGESTVLNCASLRIT